RRRRTNDGTILHTVTGPSIANGGTWVGDFDGDAVSDYLTGGHHQDPVPLYLISGADSTDGLAESRAIRTFFDPDTPRLGYAEDNNNIAAAIGDINGDATSEIAVGSRVYRINPDGTGDGRVVVFDGATGSVLYRIEPNLTYSPDTGGLFGNNIVAIGDLNGDGIGDFLVSARGALKTPVRAKNRNEGAFLAFSGVDGTELFRAYGTEDERIGDSELTAIEDLNGDGRVDLAVSSGTNGSIWLSTSLTTGDEDGFFPEDGDCNDTDTNVHPGAREYCNGVDDDCDGAIDEDFTFGFCTVGQGACQNSGTFVCTIDGDDTECSATPGIPDMEVCNNIDDDCDGTVDDDPTDASQTCTTGQPGVCNAGTTACTDGTLSAPFHNCCHSYAACWNRG
ncbi:MAG: MopE-related protein, partial [Candidatus Binatia bacterium]